MKWLSFFLTPTPNPILPPVVRHGHRCFIENIVTPFEREIISLLAKHLSHKEYFIFNNIIIPSKVLGTTEIDHVVVSKYGIFVIENKDYKGWIFAHRNRAKWTQTLSGGYKYHFRNPLLQNFAHVSALKEQMTFIKNQIFGLVVFSETASFQTEMPDGVLYTNELIDFIKSKDKPVLKEVELLVVIGKLSMICQSVDVTHQKHAEMVKEKIVMAQAAPATH